MRDAIKVNIPRQTLTKYKVHTMFNGIKQSTNQFKVDQDSFSDTLNVYIDEDNTLISRPPVVRTQLPTIFDFNSTGEEGELLPEGYDLIDVYKNDRFIIWIGKNPEGNCRATAMRIEDNTIIKYDIDFTEYHVVNYKNFFIIFNDVDAVLIDTDNFENGWELLREHAYLPTTARYIGQDVYESDGNQFTASYRTEYVWQPDIVGLLPNGDAEVEVIQSPKTLVWSMPDAKLNTEYRLLRRLPISSEPGSIMSMVYNENEAYTAIAISYLDYFMLSLDSGISFVRIPYPKFSNYKFMGKLSDDGLHYFLVAESGVYRYTIGEGKWYRITLKNENIRGSMPIIRGEYVNSCHFRNSETFAFTTVDTSSATYDIIAYHFGAGLPDADEGYMSYTVIKEIGFDFNAELDKIRLDCYNDSIRIDTEFASKTIVSVIIPDSTVSNACALITPTTDTETGALITQYHICNLPYKYVKLGEITDSYVYSNKFVTESETRLFTGITTYLIYNTGSGWVAGDTTLGVLIGTDNSVETSFTSKYDVITSDYVNEVSKGAPHRLKNGHLVGNHTISVDGDISIPQFLVSEDRELDFNNLGITVSDYDYYVLEIGNELYTNILDGNKLTTLSYDFISEEPFNKVPNCSHSDSEIYIGEENKLYITANVVEDGDILFHLPPINNNVFTQNISGIRNISNREVGVFLPNDMYIVTTVVDDIFGYRYEYYNSRLSMGMHYGDDIINSSDGKLTIYPTPKGLAVLLFQPNIAATDQVVEYLSEDVEELWREFYKKGSTKLVEFGDYLYISNGTSDYLMYHLTYRTWWRMNAPVTIEKFEVQDEELYVISDGLFKFDSSGLYKDLYVKEIPWYVVSQPLHFDLIHHYKTIKQFIFKFEKEFSVNSITADVMLYRKNNTLKSPTQIEFKLDGYTTVVKRLNCWKVNEMIWRLSSDTYNSSPDQLRLNSMSIKYHVGEEVK